MSGLLKQAIQGRYFCFTIVVRINQIEVAPGINLGVDERSENTVENLKNTAMR